MNHPTFLWRVECKSRASRSVIDRNKEQVLASREELQRVVSTSNARDSVRFHTDVNLNLIVPSTYWAGQQQICIVILYEDST